MQAKKAASKAEDLKKKLTEHPIYNIAKDKISDVHSQAMVKNSNLILLSLLFIFCNFKGGDHSKR